MRRVLPLFLLALPALPACGEDTSDDPSDLGDMDGGDGTGADAAPDEPDAAPGAPDAAGPFCGDQNLPVADITGTEGLAMAPDGTLYYSQSGAIGRRRPGMAPEDTWVSLPDGTSTVYGLVLDGALLYVAAPSAGGRIYRIDTAAAVPAAALVYGPAPGANGIVIGPDGAVYYTSLGGGHVFRVDVSAGLPGTRTQVTASTIPGGPNGLFFESPTSLLVLGYQNGIVQRLTLAAGAETGRAPAGTVGGNPDGIARDVLGRWYIGDNGGDRLVRFDADFMNPETLLNDVPAAANVVFGQGAIDCTDIYVASSPGPLAIFHGDQPGTP